jgi:multiple sugar transport system substrate-binding protein
VADVVDGNDVKGALDKAAKKVDDDIADNKGYKPFGK